jgi:hypothetical protein
LSFLVLLPIVAIYFYLKNRKYLTVSGVAGSLIPSIKKRTVILSFLAVGWTIIALIAGTAYGIVAYENVKYLLWIIPLMLPILIFLFSNSTPPVLNKREEDRTILALTVTFTCLVIVFLTGMLKGNI